MSQAIDTISRKQRERLERESLILDVAQNMLHEHGYNHLTMERIAESVQYSKGTIYNHFTSKEDLVASLCCRCMSNLIEIFEWASQYPGSTRERYSAIGIGYALYHQCYPMESSNLQILTNNAVRERVSEAKLAEVGALEQQIIDITGSIVKQAIDCGDLDQKYLDQISTIVFGCWSMHYGAIMLSQSDIPLTELGFNPVVTMLWQNANTYLDGYHWLPLSHNFNTDTMFEKISNDLFNSQLNLICSAD
jgi:AcrR family transcriptional regulator